MTATGTGAASSVTVQAGLMPDGPQVGYASQSGGAPAAPEQCTAPGLKTGNARFDKKAAFAMVACGDPSRGFDLQFTP